MNIHKLNDEAAVELFDTIVKHLKQDFVIDNLRAVLGAMVDELDDLDADDSFGTEGWRHAFGVD